MNDQYLGTGGRTPLTIPSNHTYRFHPRTLTRHPETNEVITTATVLHPSLFATEIANMFELNQRDREDFESIIRESSHLFRQKGFMRDSSSHQ